MYIDQVLGRYLYIFKYDLEINKYKYNINK